MNLHTTLIQEQLQKLSLNQIQSLEILAMPTDALHDLLQKESEENPFMEYQPSSVHEGASEFLKFIAAPEQDMVKNFIIEQLNPQEFSRPAWGLLNYLAQCVDDKGFLTITEAELSSRVPLPPGLFSSCLKKLQALQPAGIGAATVPECLKLQLSRSHRLTPLLATIIDHHLSDIASNNLHAICHALGICKKEIAAAVMCIKSLNPSPLKGLFEEASSYIVPDVIIRQTATDHEIILNDSWIASYSMSDYYVNMMHASTDPNIKAYFQAKYDRCYMLLHNIERRRRTLIALTDAIWEWQRDYIRQTHVVRPMTLKDISQKTGLHISTISRSTKDKYLQTPWRTLPFKALFQQPLQKKNSDISKDSIKHTLKNLITTENPECPYSDLQLVQLLSQQYCLPISRRVVQKYRNSLHIPNSYERKL